MADDKKPIGKDGLSPGMFVVVGSDIGVVTELPGINVPEEHVAVWYGQTTENNVPRVRTVPEEYCIAVERLDYFH